MEVYLCKIVKWTLVFVREVLSDVLVHDTESLQRPSGEILSRS